MCATEILAFKPFENRIDFDRLNLEYEICQETQKQKANVVIEPKSRPMVVQTRPHVV